MIRWFYPPLALMVILLAVLLVPFHRKIRRGLLPRLTAGRGLRSSYVKRDHTRPLVWFHAASAGELLQAEPLMERFRRQGVQLAVSLSSITATDWLTRVSGWPEMVWCGLLPPDFPWSVKGWLKHLQPSAIVHIQVDLWPGLVMEAHRAGVPQAMVAARLGRSGNYRARSIVASVYRALFGCMDLILCVTEQDRAGFAEVVPEHPKLEVGGDPGIETVVKRMGDREVQPLLRQWAGGGTVVVLGSLWPGDEAVIFPPLLKVLASDPDLRVVAAPHDPEETHLRRLESVFKAFLTVRLSHLEDTHQNQTRIVLVDGIGQLAGLYRLGVLAFVGGGFSTGVHNVAEPAICGQPVVFGPKHGNSFVAKALLAAGAATTVTNGHEMAEALHRWLKDEDIRMQAGMLGRKTVEDLAGMAVVSFEALCQLAPDLAGKLPPGGPGEGI